MLESSDEKTIGQLSLEQVFVQVFNLFSLDVFRL